MRIELTLSAWKAEVLPLNYARNIVNCFNPGEAKSKNFDEDWWAGEDSNPRSADATDLQSVLVDHFSTCPKKNNQWSAINDQFKISEY